MSHAVVTYKRRFARVLKSEIRVLEEQIYAWMAEVRERDEKIKMLEREVERLQQMQKIFEHIFPLLKFILSTANIIHRAMNFIRRKNESVEI